MEDLAQIVREGTWVEVKDAKSGQDLSMGFGGPAKGASASPAPAPAAEEPPPDHDAPAEEADQDMDEVRERMDALLDRLSKRK